MAIFRGGKRLGPFDIRVGLSRGREYDNIPGDPRLKQRANPETTINRFRSAISKGEGLARNTRFIVNISLPTGGELEKAVDPLFFDDSPGGPPGSNDNKTYNNDLAETVSLLCTNVTMPGRTINTSPYRIAGAPYKYPTQVQYSDITATFIGDKFLRLRTFFELWQNTVYNNQTGMFNFYNEYTAPIDIFQLGQFESLNDRDSKTYGVRLRECLPTSINQIQYDSGNQNGYVAIEVTFAYRDWLNFGLDIDSTGKVGGLSSGVVKAGGGLFSGLPPELRRTGRNVINQLKRSIPIGRVFGGKVFPPFTF